MYQPASFSVAPQNAHHDENTGYNTRPSFVIPGSKAAERNARRKKGSISVLQTVPNGHWGVAGSILPQYSAPHGLMTPETPDSFNMDVDSRNYHPTPHMPRDFSNGSYADYHTSHPAVPTPFSFLPITPSPSYTPIQHWSESGLQPNRFSPTVYPESHSEDLVPDSDSCLDPGDGHMFAAEDLSPLAIDDCQLLPAFEDVSVKDRSTGSSSENIPRLRKAKKMTKVQAIKSAQTILLDADMTPTSFLLHLLGRETSSPSARTAFFRRTNEDNICELLSTILEDDKGSRIFKQWLVPHAVDIVCDLVSNEMEAAKPSLFMTTAQTTPEFIEGWDINKIMDPIARDITPTWTSVLHAASEPKGSHDNKSRNRPTTRNIISSQVHYLRSQNSCKVQIGLGLMASSTGASRNLMNVLQRCGLTTSFSSIATTVSALAGFSVQQAAKVSQGPHAFAYDNMNMKSSIFVEQRPDAMSKVQSGTFPVIYELPHARLEDMRLAPMMENLKKAKPLKMQDLRASVAAATSYLEQTTVNISKILLKYVPELSDLRSNPLFQNKPRRQLPPGEKTRCYPVCASTIEEASITGNIHVHNEVYIHQLKRDPQELNDYAIPCLNDQLTNSRIRSVQALHTKDLSPWERREIFMLAFGTFHLLMNLIWALLNVHRGTISGQGSLAYYFNILEKVRLASEKPDFHTLLTALTQILEGLIFNAWHKECGQPSLSDFAKTDPKPEDIISIARRIIKKYATPTSEIPKSDGPKSGKKAKKSKTCNDSDPEDEIEETSPVDPVYRNTTLLTRDLLYVIELTGAIASGDFGRIEAILPDIACIFRGAGSNNYSTEILHLIFNIKEVWTLEFANIMRDIMLVNPSGLQGHAMGIDMNIEHLIGYLKALFAAKGIYADWDRLGNISAAVNYLQLIKKRVTTSLGTSYQGSTHTNDPVFVLVIRIADHARDLEFQHNLQNRRDVQSKTVPNLHRVGYRKFETSSLATYNKKMEDLKMGRGFDADETDDISPAEFQETIIDTDGSVVTTS